MIIGLVAAALSASAVAADLNAAGPRATVARLVSGGDWDRTLEAIAGGRRDWIALVPQLARGVEGEGAEDLGMALAQALPVAPADVLAVVDLQRGRVIGVQRVCGAPFLPDTVPDLPGYIAGARAAVAAVSPLTLGRARAQCLQQLEIAAAR